MPKVRCYKCSSSVLMFASHCEDCGEPTSYFCTDCYGQLARKCVCPDEEEENND